MSKQQFKTSALAVVTFVKSVFSQDGEGSWSRVGSGIVVLCWCAVMLRNRAVPDHSEGVAYVIMALYGMNQLGSIGDAFTKLKAAVAPAPPAQPNS